MTPDTLELVYIEIQKPKRKPILIATWCRLSHSNIDLFQNFEQFLQSPDDENQEIIITEDLSAIFLNRIKASVLLNYLIL